MGVLSGPSSSFHMVRAHTENFPVESATSPAAARVVIVSLPLSAWGLERLVDSGLAPLRCAGVAHSAAEAALKLDDWNPDVVLFDMDGEEGTESLSDLQGRTHARVLALTSSSHTAVHDAAVLAGARGVVSKGVDPGVLLKALVKVHAGEIWVDRTATGRLFSEFARLRNGTADDPEKARINLLTPRERQMLNLLARDTSSTGKALAHRLHISENTFRNHLTSIYSKLGVANRVELYAYALRHGIGAMP